MGTQSFRLQKVIGRRGLPTVVVEGSAPQYLHSLYDPVMEAQQLVDGWNIDFRVKKLVVIGLGLGYHVVECLRRMPSDAEVTVISCQSQLVEFVSADLPELICDERLNLYLADTEERLRLALKDVDVQQLRFHAPSLAIIPYPKLRWQLQEMHMLQMNTQSAQPLLLANWHKNRAWLADERILNGRSDSHRGMPGVLIAAGPSMDLLLPELPDIQERAILLSVGAVLKKLLHHQIMPKYAAITDAHAKALSQFTDLRVEDRLPELFALVTVDPAIRAYPGPLTWVLQSGVDEVEAFAAEIEAETFATGGSVATLGLQLLYYFGCDPIIFVGQDLAYVEGNTHAKDVHIELTQNDRQSTTRVKATSVSGNEIETTISWNSFRHWIEQFISNHPKRTYYNASLGADIRGTKILAPQALRSILCS